MLRLAIGLTLACLLIAFAAALATEPQGLPCEGVLILRHGEILGGRVSKVGDKYIVAVADGGELRLAVRDVEMHCHSLEEAYLRKKETLGAQDVSSHLALADWCLKCGLHSRAADELLTAMTIDPRNPKIKLLERRLQIAVSTRTPPANPPAQKTAAVGLDDLERTIRQLPTDAVEQYASQVQPLLLNRCGANSCHGARTTTSLRLIRPSSGDIMSRRFTQRNLYSVLQSVDAGSPQTSRLLTVPSQPHGNLASAVFGERDEPQVRLLANWIIQATGRGAAPPSTISDPPANLMQTSLDAPVRLPLTDADPIGAGGPPSHGVSAARTGLRAEPSPRDPFDPEIFNRQHVTSAPANPD